MQVPSTENDTIVIPSEGHRKSMRCFGPPALWSLRWPRLGFYNPRHRTSDGRYFFGFIADVRFDREGATYDGDRWQLSQRIEK